jgi:hypothetical protein
MLPERKAIGRMGEEFVDIRLRALRRFVVRLCSSTEVCNGSTSLRQFISLPAEAFSSLKEAKSGAGAMVQGAAAAATKGVFSMLKVAATTISAAANTATGGRVGTAAGADSHKAKTAEDLSFEEIENYISQQAPLVMALYNRAAGQAVRSREQAQLLLEYGAALRAFGQTEGGALGNALSSSGLAVWAESTANYEAAVEESELFVYFDFIYLYLLIIYL